MIRRKALIFILVLASVNAAMAQKKQVRKGNRLYQEKQYAEAAGAYQQALRRNPGFTPGLFNLGNALIQQKNYDAARKVLGAAAKNSREPAVKADANYNVGNTYMQEQKWQEAVDSYKQALRNNPSDEDAKYNLSYAMAMLKKNQGGGGGKDKKENEQQQQQDKQKQDGQDQQQQDQQQQDQQKQQEQQEQNDNQQRPQPQPSKLSEEQADQLLKALAQEEKKLHDKKEKVKAVNIKVDKDW